MTRYIVPARVNLSARGPVFIQGAIMISKRYALAAICGLGLTAAAPPTRETGLDIPSAQSGDILVACIKKRLSGVFLGEKPIEGGGLSLEAVKYPNSMFFGHPTLYFDITEAEETRHIKIHYRHPMSAESASKYLRNVGKKCFPYELEAAGGGKLPG